MIHEGCSSEWKVFHEPTEGGKVRRPTIKAFHGNPQPSFFLGLWPIFSGLKTFIFFMVLGSSGWFFVSQGWRFKVGSTWSSSLESSRCSSGELLPTFFSFRIRIVRHSFDMIDLIRWFKATNAQQREKVRENGKLKLFGNAMVGNWKGQKKCNFSLFNHLGLESRWRR